MLWEIEIRPRGRDAEALRVQEEIAHLGLGDGSEATIAASARGFLLEGEIERGQAEFLLERLLVDPLVERGELAPLGELSGAGNRFALTVLLKPGVMDPVAQSVAGAARDLGMDLATVRTFRRYFTSTPLAPGNREALCRRILANDAIEQVVDGPLHLDHLTPDAPYRFRRIEVPLRDLDEAGLTEVSRQGQLSLSTEEMVVIREHFREQGRDPTDVELETLAQTWSEHCSHKTLKGRIDFDGKRYDNLLKETIFGATQEIRQRLGSDDWCLSVFEDNAGIVRFDDRWAVCFKVETHNHPSAIEPYGGANTGLGGVIRDVLGTGLGARPICNTDVFCFAPPGRREALPPGVLHPERVIRGVVAGVRDYGNRMGIPTVNGAVCFDERYLGNPLVFCGTVGLMPIAACTKEVLPGDLIVAVGGRTGRDGIHGATFSSVELTSESETLSGGAVQIGNAITEKKVLDVLLQARDRGLYRAVTDCGAGGFSSAVGEMGAEVGARVDLEKAPLKYAGLTYTEIWISEAQERMVLAVPPEKWDELHAVCAAEDVEAVVLGTFEPTGRLTLFFHGEQVADLDMHFLHEGRPKVVRQATWRPAAPATVSDPPKVESGLDPVAILKGILSSGNVCSKEWIVRQYDHEVQGASVLKPLVGVQDDGPGDAAVLRPVRDSWRGLAIGCGINPRLGDLDPYRMAALAIDEAVRNVAAVGADPRRVALLDNFCWGNTKRPETLGSLVRAAEACRDIALAYGTPFISGKDSLNNEFQAEGIHLVIPSTLLISALGIVPDVRRCVTMDLKKPGNVLVLLGKTDAALGGSHLHLVTGRSGGEVPEVDPTLAPRLFAGLHEAIAAGLVRSCHDLSEGGLAVAAAEMAFAGEVGADLTSVAVAGLPDETTLFAESPTRFLLEVEPAACSSLETLFGKEVPWRKVGVTVKEPRLRIAGKEGDWILWASLAELKEAWQAPLRW